MPRRHLQSQYLRNLKRLLLAIVGITIVGLGIATSLLLLKERQTILRNSGANLQAIAVTLSKEADATLDHGAASLERIKPQLKFDDRGQLQDPDAIHRLLETESNFYNRAIGSDKFGHMEVFDANGFVVANSDIHPFATTNVADRKYFQHHRINPDNRLYISQPHLSEYSGEPILHLTKRLQDTEQQFLGVIGIHLKLSHFDSLYGQLDLNDGSHVTLLRTDGWGVFRYPQMEAFYKRSLAGNRRFNKMLAQGSGYLPINPSPYDGVRRLVAYQISDSYPILNLISVPEAQLLRHWRRQSLRTLSYATLGGLMLLGLTLFTYHQLNRLQSTLRASSSDPLTGLANRRELDRRLTDEWRRARRKRHSLSMLFIDIDHFKSYNDHYGHQAGDDCLVRVAEALQQQFRRGGELVCRYGGEEFVVLLSQDSLTDRPEQMADQLRLRIQRLGLKHDYSDTAEVVTISLGVATLIPMDNEPATLIRLADEALYQAKRNGRNQVALAPTSP
ncbi:GGDEF domain-containing protein [Motiliproteus coralliicola]|uniref:diguanylate cyclase n=1 Tax=Motiliproteus coralliicola TaxID=2283196 RepID=A0A369WXC9_9GAMM|nr:sensor domain-containing diguanylate cyclase [Motiliproteus coralliicola]RDE25184.1 GGDEF domain-containing protein [Motiliproteus coralliicola]